MAWRGCLLLVLGALLLGACGGDDEGGDGGTAAEGDYVTRANELCIGRAAEVRQQFNQVVNPTTAQEFADLLPERVEIEEEFVDELGALEAPSESAAAFQTYVDKEEAVAEDYRQALEAANRVDTPAFARANEQLEQTQLDAATAAADIKLEDCANQLPAEDEAAVKAVLESIWTTADPAHCAEDYTSAYIEELGGLNACVKGEVPSAEADSIELGGISGSRGVTANVEVTIHGGSHDGEVGQNFLEFVDGRWKLDQIVVVKPPSAASP